MFVWPTFIGIVCNKNSVSNFEFEVTIGRFVILRIDKGHDRTVDHWLRQQMLDPLCHHHLPCEDSVRFPSDFAVTLRHQAMKA